MKINVRLCVFVILSLFVANYSLKTSLWLMNMPSDFAVLGGMCIVPLTILGMYKLFVKLVK